MRNYTWGILAHVDAGKTTLSEALLYHGGQISSLGRVDHGDAYLDTDSQEKARGITIFSKPARLSYKGADFTLLDTPGHVDFATETERALWALDYCILLISATDGVQAHTRTLFRLAEDYGLPMVIFINKLDQPGANQDRVMEDIRAQLSDKCCLASDLESIAMESEEAMEEYLETGDLSSESIFSMVNEGRVYLTLAGSALKDQGVEDLLKLMADLSAYNEKKEAETQAAPQELGLRIYKIEALGRDQRLTFAKVTSGCLKVKDTLPNGEKADQLRIYSGVKYSQVEKAGVGDIVAIAGPKKTYAGQGLGLETDRKDLKLTPVLQYSIEFLDETIARVAYENIRRLSDEDPSLQVTWDGDTEEIRISLMGQVQTEILTQRIKDELGYDISFKECGIIYKETLAGPVEGVGHFEPLRHYAEAHIFMEPLPTGSGIQVDCQVATDDLALNWQRLIATHILERDHLGVKLGAPLTDIKYTIVGGRAHIKHTEGGDFREATYRAIRQGLMEAGTVVLEPYYTYQLRLPSNQVGRAMTDIETMAGTFISPEEDGGMSILKGHAPAATIRNYGMTVAAYTKGEGSLALVYEGYFPCHNEQDVVEERSYDPEADTDNPSASVFCSHGTSDIVSWDRVKDMCHVPCRLTKQAAGQESDPGAFSTKREHRSQDMWLDPDEIDAILRAATHSNGGKNPKKGWSHGTKPVRHVDSDYVYTAPKQVNKREKYMLVDGYNLIHAWPQLKAVLEDNLDGARGKLLDILSNYKAMTDYEIIAVFDAYRVKGHEVEVSDYLNIHQVFTREAQTADAYIEKFTHEHGRKYDITVVTSDGLEQLIIRGAGAHLISSREFIEEVGRRSLELREKYGIGQEEN